MEASNALPGGTIPAGYHFAGDGQKRGTPPEIVLKILEGIGMPLEPGETLSFSSETMRLLRQ